jgi:hypothetical protein
MPIKQSKKFAFCLFIVFETQIKTIEPIHILIHIGKQNCLRLVKTFSTIRAQQNVDSDHLTNARKWQSGVKSVTYP